MNDVADGISRHPEFEPAERASFVDMKSLLRSILADNDESDDVGVNDGLYFANVDTAELLCYVMSERDIASCCRAAYPQDARLSIPRRIDMEDRRIGRFRQLEIVYPG